MTPELVTLADIQYVMANLSPQNRGEQGAYGLTDEALLAHLERLHSDGRSEVTKIDGNPAVIFGVVNGFTWFIATPDFFALGKQGIKYARERLADFRTTEGPLICQSRSPHPAAAKWFRLLGFVEKSERSVDRERVFVYQ